MNTDRAPGSSTEIVEEEYVLSLADLLQVIRRRLWVIALTVVVCVGAAVGLSLYMTPQYEGAIKILVGQKQQNQQFDSLGSDVQGLQQLTQTMAEAVDSRPVAGAVIEKLGLHIDAEEFLDNMSVEQVPETQFVAVSYRDPDPRNARRVADTIGEVFSRQVSDVSPSANSITATVWEKAALPEDPVSPNIPRNVLLALALGLIIGTGLAFLVEYLDDSWRSPEEAERISGVPTFGMIPAFDIPKAKKRAR